MTPLDAIPILPTVRTQPGALWLAANRSDRGSAVRTEEVIGGKAGPWLHQGGIDRPVHASIAPTQLETLRQSSCPHTSSRCPPILKTVLQIHLPNKSALKLSARRLTSNRIRLTSDP